MTMFKMFQKKMLPKSLQHLLLKTFLRRILQKGLRATIAGEVEVGSKATNTWLLRRLIAKTERMKIALNFRDRIREYSQNCIVCPVQIDKSEPYFINCRQIKLNASPLFRITSCPEICGNAKIISRSQIVPKARLGLTNPKHFRRMCQSAGSSSAAFSIY
jgi:hypothetical protein